MNVNLTYGNTNALNDSTTVLVYPTLSADSAIELSVNDTLNADPLTAFATALSFSQVNNGDNGFGVWTKAFTTFEVKETLPFKLSNTASAAGKTELTVALSALGDVSANGKQFGYINVTLSAFALSGNSAGSVVRVAVDNSPVTLTTVITAALIPYATSPVVTDFSEPEAQRLRMLGYI